VVQSKYHKKFEDEKMEVAGIDPVVLIAYLIPFVVIGFIAYLIRKARDHSSPKE
jgi:hypothetical protein